MKLLIIEDEYRLADMLNDWFVKKGDSVSICTNGLEGFGKAVSDSFDVIILDIMLPGRDGFSILSGLRKKGINTPVLILSARSELDDKLKGFGSGAEDYLTKPFHIEELDARVSVLARKVQDAPSKKEVLENTGEKISIGDLELDKNSHILRNVNSGLTVELSSKEYILMEYFLMNAVEPEMTFYGNEVQLKRLVGILIDNAIGHTESGHEIIVSLKKEERKTVLSVKNQGEPIPLHEQKKIFEQFYQTDSSRHREKGRYGLGLSIAAEIAKKHQTDIKIRCQNGWTEFYLFFS